MQNKDMSKADFITSIVLIALSVTIINMSIKMPRFEHRGANPWSVPGIVPGILGGIIGFLGIVLFIRSIKQQGYKLDLTKGKLIDWFRKPASIRLWLTILLTVGYAWGLIGWMSYPLATFLFIFAFIIIFEYNRQEIKKMKLKRIITAFFIALISAVAISVVFQYGFLIRLP